MEIAEHIVHCFPRLGELIPVVSSSAKGLVPNSKAIDNLVMNGFNNTSNKWMRIAKGTNSINSCSSIITISNEWNNTSSHTVVFILNAMCRQNSSISVLHTHNVSSNKFFTKIRLVKTSSELYVDVYINQYATAGGNNIYTSFCGSKFLESVIPTEVQEEQSGFTIEEFNL